MLLLLSGTALLASGCGSSTRASQAGLRLQREDLIAAARALERSSAEVSREVTATKAAWRLVANGLPASAAPAQEATIATAARAAATLKLPTVFDEQRSARLTGPAASISGAFRGFAALTARGWQMILYTLTSQRRSSGSQATSFARANVALYIESVYDAHFGLSQIGKKLLAGWEKLGGQGAFGAALPRAEVERLARTYSEADFRLHPHDGVKLGS